MKKFTVKPKTFLSNKIRIGLQSEKAYPEQIFIGRLAEVGGIVQTYLECSSEHVVSIFGKRGSGKSYSLGSLIEGLCVRAQQSSIATISKRRAVILFDTLGIYQWMNVPLNENSQSDIIKSQAAMHKRWNLKPEALDILLFNPSDSNSDVMQTNRFDFTLNVPDLSASDWGYLLGLDIYADRMGQLLNDIHIKVTQEGWATRERTFKPLKNYSLQDMINCCNQDTELAQIYHTETRRAILQQLMTYSRNSLFQREGLKLSHLLRSGYLSIIMMHKIPDELRLVIVSSLIRKILQNRIEASEQEKDAMIRGDQRRLNELKNDPKMIPPCWIVIDEAQNLMPSERKNPAGELLVKLVREGRNFGISFMFTTQQPSAIDPRILAQVDTMLIHRLTVQQDIDYVKRNLKSALPDEIRYSGRNLSFDESIRLLDVGQVFVSNTELDRGFYMDVRPRISVHGGF